MNTQLYMADLHSPLGGMRCLATDSAFVLLQFCDHLKLDEQISFIGNQFGIVPYRGEHQLFHELQLRLTEYFSGSRREFDLPIQLVGTDFQKDVWTELQWTNYSERISYGDLAVRIGMPAAIRAVANANASNKIMLLVPCHRIVGSNGKLTGYAGGLSRKRALLDLENIQSLF